MARRRRRFRVFVGSQGRCPDCNKLTGVKLAATGARMKEVWYLARDTMLEIMRATAIHSSPSYQDRTVKGEYTREEGCKPRCSQCCRDEEKWLYWIELEASKELAGPFCTNCLARRLTHLEDEEGKTESYRMFATPIDVRFGEKAAQVVRAIEEARMEEGTLQRDEEEEHEVLLF